MKKREAWVGRVRRVSVIAQRHLERYTTGILKVGETVTVIIMSTEVGSVRLQDHQGLRERRAHDYRAIMLSISRGETGTNLNAPMAVHLRDNPERRI